jgi:hypothetical protein
MGVPPGREGDLVKSCLQLLRARGVLAWRVNGGGMKVGRRFVRFNSINGVSDILGVLPGGRFLAVECKVGDNHLTPHQAAFLQALTVQGGLTLVVWDVAELDRALRASGGKGRAT